MNIYKISCYSKCGSYFSSYLQSVTVVAKDEASALMYVKEWMKSNGESFIYPEKEWEILLLCSNIGEGMIIDSHNDSDY